MTSTSSNAGPGRDLLDWLLAPDETADFLKTAWEREVRHVARHDAHYYGSLFSVDELDQLLAHTALPSTNLNLANDGEPVAADQYAAGAFVDMDRVLSLHAQGATIILRSVEQWHEGLDRLNRQATRQFDCVTQINLYATPASQQSTPPHWDTHDLFILQVHGEKHWKLYEADRVLPSARERFQPGVDTVGPLSGEIRLEPGDLLYLPRGTIHEPQADSYSIHVSLGVVPTRMADLMQQVVRLAAANVEELRRGLPPPAAEVGDLAIENAVLAGLRSMVNRDLVRAVLEDHRRSIADLAPDVSGRLREIAQLEEPDGEPPGG